MTSIGLLNRIKGIMRSIEDKESKDGNSTEFGRDGRRSAKSWSANTKHSYVYIYKKVIASSGIQ